VQNRKNQIHKKRKNQVNKAKIRQPHFKKQDLKKSYHEKIMWLQPFKPRIKKRNLQQIQKSKSRPKK
jgi:hypothetical protein